MDLKRPLFIGTVLLIAFAAIWIMTQAIPQLAILFVVGLLSALAGFVVLLFWQRDLTGPDRNLSMSGSIGALVWFGAVLVLALVANPITFKGEPGETAINEEPPAAVDATARIVTSLLPLAIMVGAVVALWPAWTMLERSLGAVGALLFAMVAVPPLMGLGYSSTVGMVIFGIALLAWLTALVLPLAMPRTRSNEWAGPQHLE